MALVQSELSSRILSAFNKQLETKTSSSEAPGVPVDVADGLAQAYHLWVMSGFPTAPLTFSVPPIQQTLSSALVVPEFKGWGPGLVAYWSPTQLTGPGFIPANPISPSVFAAFSSLVLTLSETVGGIISGAAADRGETPSGVADKLASALFTFTVSLSFMMTTTTMPPTTAVVPVA